MWQWIRRPEISLLNVTAKAASGRATIAMPTITSHIAQKYERGAPMKDASTWQHGKKWQHTLVQKKGSHVKDANWA